MSRPVIGLCTTIARARWSYWDQEAALLPRSYVDAIQREGAMALMIPPDRVLEEKPDELLDLVDGLVLAGGVDIDPAAYGAEPHPETDAPVPARDRSELALARRALERDIPLLGICRGMQLINVATGGTLRQHLPEAIEAPGKRFTLGVQWHPEVDDRSRLVGALVAEAAAQRSSSPTS